MDTMKSLIEIYVGENGLISTYISLAWYILLMIANWKIFTKAGEKGWKSLIPIYNIYILFKLAWRGSAFWVLLLGMILGAVIGNVSYTIPGFLTPVMGILAIAIGLMVFLMPLILQGKLSSSFGKGALFTLGLIFLNPIFMLILGFGSSEYQKNN